MRRVLVLTLLALLSGAAPATAESTLKLGVVAFPPAGPDPRKSVSAIGAYTWSPMLEALTAFTETSELVPELALSWSAPTPTTWILKLRPGVRFSNGAPMDAAAVAANFAWMLTAEGKSSVVGRSIESLSGARAVDPLTVEITTSTPDAILPRELATFYIVEPRQWNALGPEGFAKQPIGTGPFVLESWGPARIVYRANPASWRKPKLDRLEILNLPDLTPRVQAFVTGRIDIAIGMGPDEQAQIEAAGGRLHRRAAMDVMSIVFVIGQGKPTDDLRVRRALNYAVNKEAITEVLLHGLTEPAGQGAVRGLFGYNDAVAPYPYDPAKARALLKEAGFAAGFTLNTEIIVSQNANDAAAYQMIATDLAAVGVKMNLTPIPLPQMMKVINQGEWRGDSFSQIWGAIPTFDPLRTLRLHTCLWPKPWFCDRSATAKLEAAIAEFDEARRAAMIRELMAFYHDQATALYLYELPILDAVGKRVRNYAPQRSRINYETIGVE
jgi:peptide/nickel transport system substrate-binding protein